MESETFVLVAIEKSREIRMHFVTNCNRFIFFHFHGGSKCFRFIPKWIIRVHTFSPKDKNLKTNDEKSPKTWPNTIRIHNFIFSYFRFHSHSVLFFRGFDVKKEGKNIRKMKIHVWHPKICIQLYNLVICIYLLPSSLVLFLRPQPLSKIIRLII